jgi:hypothetical protein
VKSAEDWTAFGTILLAVATFITIAVTVVLATRERHDNERRLLEERDVANQRLQEEQQAADRRLAEQRTAADERLAKEQQAADGRLRDERQAAGERLQEERQAALEREQLAQAYMVQVTAARMTPEEYGSLASIPSDVEASCPVAIIVNGGAYTIRRIEAQLCMRGNTLTSYGRPQHFSSWWNLDDDDPIISGVARPEPSIVHTTLTPTDRGLRFLHDAVHEPNLVGCYPIVRWQDHWGTWWEHRQGIVRRIQEGEDWRA